MTRVAVILSGCGVYDGAEIHEAVLTLLYLEKGGADIKCYAPDKPQMHVVNHLKGEPEENQSRNVLVESARIARGEIAPISDLQIDTFDAVVIPGGFGAAKNLCSLAVDGDACSIDADVQQIIIDAVDKDIVIGAICIAPALVARALKDKPLNPVMTIGTDASTAGALRAMGAENQPASVNEIVVDTKNKIVTTPAYMLGQSIVPVAEGIEKLVAKVLEMA